MEPADEIDALKREIESLKARVKDAEEDRDRADRDCNYADDERAAAEGDRDDARRERDEALAQIRDVADALRRAGVPEAVLLEGTRANQVLTVAGRIDHLHAELKSSRVKYDAYKGIAESRVAELRADLARLRAPAAEVVANFDRGIHVVSKEERDRLAAALSPAPGEAEKKKCFFPTCLCTSAAKCEGEGWHWPAPENASEASR